MKRIVKHMHGLLIAGAMTALAISPAVGKTRRSWMQGTIR